MRLRLTAALLMLIVAGCGGTAGRTTQSPVAAISPSASTSSSASPSSSPAASASPSASTVPGPAGTELVISDVGNNQVRLARLDATDTATVTGLFDGVVGGHVIVVNGTALESLTPPNTLRRLGTLAGQTEWLGEGTVAVKADLSGWLYTVPDSSWTSTIHLGTPAGDRAVATLPSPDGNAFYQPFAWNASGAYFSRQATGLGGAGPFLDYRFPLERFDVSSGRMTDVTPTCIAYAVLGDGTMICRSSFADSHLQVRTQSGLTISIQVTLGTGTGTNSAYWHVLISPDNSRVVVTRNGAKDPTINYQMAVAGLTESTAAAFGPLDFLSDAWLSDGRLVADHVCVLIEWGGGPCSSSLDGTYIFSSDGLTHTLFYKLKTGVVVASV